jgi:hypothetical protein
MFSILLNFTNDLGKGGWYYGSQPVQNQRDHERTILPYRPGAKQLQARKKVVSFESIVIGR